MDEFDIYLLGFRVGEGRDPAEALARAFGLGPAQARELIGSLPRIVKRRVSAEARPRYERVLEELGASYEFRRSPIKPMRIVAVAGTSVDAPAPRRGDTLSLPPPPLERPASEPAPAAAAVAVAAEPAPGPRAIAAEPATGVRAVAAESATAARAAAQGTWLIAPAPRLDETPSATMLKAPVAAQTLPLGEHDAGALPVAALKAPVAAQTLPLGEHDAGALSAAVLKVPVAAQTLPLGEHDAGALWKAPASRTVPAYQVHEDVLDRASSRAAPASASQTEPATPGTPSWLVEDAVLRGRMLDPEALVASQPASAWLPPIELDDRVVGATTDATTNATANAKTIAAADTKTNAKTNATPIAATGLAMKPGAPTPAIGVPDFHEHAPHTPSSERPGAPYATRVAARPGAPIAQPAALDARLRTINAAYEEDTSSGSTRYLARVGIGALVFLVLITARSYRKWNDDVDEAIADWGVTSVDAQDALEVAFADMPSGTAAEVARAWSDSNVHHFGNGDKERTLALITKLEKAGARGVYAAEITNEGILRIAMALRVDLPAGREARIAIGNEIRAYNASAWDLDPEEEADYGDPFDGKPSVLVVLNH